MLRTRWAAQDIGHLRRILKGENLMVKCALVCGAGGFIGCHLVKRLKRDGFWVRGVDLKFHEFSETAADDFVVGDLRDQGFCRTIVDRRFDEVYRLAADMGARVTSLPANTMPT
jgi:nucleoside-diphosphate-sugar epimerase